MSMLSHLHQLFDVRHLPRLYPSSALERSAAAMSAVSESRGRFLGQLPLPLRVPTLSLPRLQADLQ